MANTTHIVKNALISTPDPNVSVMKKCTVFPVEFVCRGFMTGSTDTSLWTHYKAGEREYCGNQFPDGMKKNDRLSSNVITPTTKSESHDVPISPADIVKQGLMSQGDWDKVWRGGEVQEDIGGGYGAEATKCAFRCPQRHFSSSNLAKSR